MLRLHVDNRQAQTDSKRRPIADKFDTHYCTAFLPISKSEKQKMKNKKSYGKKRLILREYLKRRENG